MRLRVPETVVNIAHIPKLNRPRDGSGIGRGDARAVRAGFPVTVPKQGDLGERIRDEFPAPAHLPPISQGLGRRGGSRRGSAGQFLCNAQLLLHLS